LALDTLAEAEARELLNRHFGREKVATESEAVNSLLKRCAGLPLALGGARLLMAVCPERDLLDAGLQGLRRAPGPVQAPRESDPHHMPPEFNVDQQHFLETRQQGEDCGSLRTSAANTARSTQSRRGLGSAQHG
jgi:hypothetical protein